MIIDRKTALRFWQDVFGLHRYVQDCFGSWIHRDDYEDFEKQRIRPHSDGKPANFGWSLNRLRPENDYANERDAMFFNNYEPMHHLNSITKGSEYPIFRINDIQYKVVFCTVCQTHHRVGYGIVDLSTNQRIDWKHKLNSCFT